MALSERQTYMSVDEYLTGEREARVRHEYIDGQIYAMAGASDRHNRLAGNIYARLSLHLDGNRCEPFVSDMKVKVDAVVYYYPDVVVTCDDAPPDNDTREQSVLIVEVTSPSTERLDRQEKLIAYKRVPSMREYVMVSQERVMIEVHRRKDQTNEWVREVLSKPDDTLHLESVNLTLPVQDIYRNVRFNEPFTQAII